MKLRFIIDTQLPPSDKEIIALAKSEARIIVTKDREQLKVEN